MDGRPTLWNRRRCFDTFLSQVLVRLIVDTRDKTANTTLDNQFVQDLSLALTGVPV